MLHLRTYCMFTNTLSLYVPLCLRLFQIVPVTITGVAEAMPPSALAPIRRPKNVVVQLHPAIDPAGRDLGEVMREARKAVASGLPDWQLRDEDKNL
jgi:hypothetical protein